jgi:hypothetical protein
LNGANYFQFGIEGDDNSPVAKRIIPFFSRRMGLDENGQPIPINYGGKLTGQYKNWNIGLLHMNDERQVGEQNFSVMRISRIPGKTISYWNYWHTRKCTGRFNQHAGRSRSETFHIHFSGK